jgi:uracil-DNA glycosylase
LPRRRAAEYGRHVPEFDRGPSDALARHFAAVPDPPVIGDFWFNWGPVFYRGRLDGSARVLCVASDPGPTERIAGRTLIGNAGQRVQGFLRKLGLTRSYLCVNAWAYALHPSRAGAEQKKLSDPAQARWRNAFYDEVTGPDLQAIVAFGGMAQEAVKHWSSKPSVPIKSVPHPSSRDATALIAAWRAAIADLRAVVTPDPDGDNTGPNYGAKFAEHDYAAIPRSDLPFGAPDFLGDDSWVRANPGGDQNSVDRNGDTQLRWDAPE